MAKLEITELDPDIICRDERFAFWDFINTSRKNELISEIKNSH